MSPPSSALTIRTPGGVDNIQCQARPNGLTGLRHQYVDCFWRNGSLNLETLGFGTRLPVLVTWLKLTNSCYAQVPNNGGIPVVARLLTESPESSCNVKPFNPEARTVNTPWVLPPYSNSL